MNRVEAKEVLDQIAQSAKKLSEHNKATWELKSKVADLGRSLGLNQKSSILHNFDGEDFVFEFDGDGDIVSGDIVSTVKLHNPEELFPEAVAVIEAEEKLETEEVAEETDSEEE